MGFNFARFPYFNFAHFEIEQKFWIDLDENCKMIDFN